MASLLDLAIQLPEDRDDQPFNITVYRIKPFRLLLSIKGPERSTRRSINTFKAHMNAQKIQTRIAYFCDCAFRTYNNRLQRL